jgi:general secretion pathway protein G
MENKQDKGFTLVELLIVIVILGILATVTVFAVRGITNQGETSACAADEKTLQTAVEAYFAQEGGTTIPATGTPASVENTLATAGLIVEASDNFDVSTGGAVTVTTGGGCDGVTF